MDELKIMKKPALRGPVWSDEELTAAVDAYLYMLQLERSSIPFSAERHAGILLSSILHKRNEGSIRYRMRNISCVMEERDMPTLQAFSPAHQVGRNVKRRLHNIIDERSDVLAVITEIDRRPKETPALADVLNHLAELKDQLAELHAVRKVGIGHNNPPDKMDISKEETSTISDAIDRIENAIIQEQPDRELIQHCSDQISAFGLKIWVWAGQRITDFARAGAVAAGTGFGLSLSGVGDKIVETLRSVFHFLF